MKEAEPDPSPRREEAKSRRAWAEEGAKWSWARALQPSPYQRQHGGWKGCHREGRPNGPDAHVPADGRSAHGSRSGQHGQPGRNPVALHRTSGSRYDGAQRRNYHIVLDLSMDDPEKCSEGCRDGSDDGSGRRRSKSVRMRPNQAGSSIFTSLQQMGLKLEPRKAPLAVIVIDHLEKSPTEN